MPIRSTSYSSIPRPTDRQRPPFTIEKNDRAYVKQYANLYWLRLVVLRKTVLQRARNLWSEGPERPQHVPRMLDVKTGIVCYIVGTVYMDMPLKPNVLEDLARDHYIAAPPPKRKFCSVSDEIMLEDESGRVRLVGPAIEEAAGHFVTGTIMAALGRELASGDFEVSAFCYAGLPPQAAPTQSTEDAEEGMQIDRSNEDDEWVAILSGLEIGDGDRDQELQREMLCEWLLGELGGDEDASEATKITRVILAGDSLTQPEPIDESTEEDGEKKANRYGYDSSAYSAKPAASFDSFLSQLLPSMNVDMMPGANDPVAPTMPQPSLHPAMLPNANAYEGFGLRTNPFWVQIGDSSFLGTSGQPLDDIFKYLTTEDRLGIACNTLEWSHIAPTCPDTLWCYPFSDRDPFILHSTPHVYFIGNQPRYETRLITSDKNDGTAPTRSRVILVPKFKETGQVVLVNSRSLEVKVVEFQV